MKYHRRTASLLALSIILLASLACNFPGASRRASLEATQIPVSSQSVEELATQVGSAAATALSGGQVELTFTEAQLTSLAATQIQSIQDPQVTNIQVRLQNGQMEISGDVKRSGTLSSFLDLPFSIILTITVDSQGMPRANIVDASIGPFPVPDGVLQEITARLDQALAEQYAAEGKDMIIESITIANGTMTVKGHLR